MLQGCLNLCFLKQNLIALRDYAHRIALLKGAGRYLDGDFAVMQPYDYGCFIQTLFYLPACPCN